MVKGASVCLGLGWGPDMWSQQVQEPGCQPSGALVEVGGPVAAAPPWDSPRRSREPVLHNPLAHVEAGSLFLG